MLVKFAIIGAVTIAFAYLFLASSGDANFRDALSIIVSSDGAAAVILCLLTSFFRAVRLNRLLAQRSQRLAECYAIVTVHNTLNNLLPFRLGEISIPVMLKTTFDVPVPSGIAALSILRFFDFAAIGFIFLLFGPSLMSFSDESRDIFLYGGALFFLFAGGLASASPVARRLIPAVASPDGAIKERMRSRLRQACLQALRMLEDLKPRQLLELGLCTVAMWTSIVFVAWVCSRHVGLPVGFGVIALGVAVVSVANLLPISGLANFGTFEFSWIILIGFFSDAQGLAYESAIAFHVMILIGAAASLLSAVPTLHRVFKAKG